MEIKLKNKIIDSEEILEDLVISKNDVVFIAGSLVEGSINKYSHGMGNSLSDIDIIVVSSNLKDIHGEYNTKHKVTTFSKLRDKTNLDIEYHDMDFIINGIDLLEKLSFDRNQRVWNYFPYDYEEYDQFFSFVHRFLNSICIFNKNNYDNLLKKLNLENYFKFNAKCCTNNIEQLYDDAIGNLEVKNYSTTLQIVRNMSLLALKALIFCERESLDRDKWIFLKIENIKRKNKNLKRLIDEHIYLHFKQAIFTPLDYERIIEKYLKTINKTIRYIEGGLDL